LRLTGARDKVILCEFDRKRVPVFEHNIEVTHSHSDTLSVSSNMNSVL